MLGWECPPSSLKMSSHNLPFPIVFDEKSAYIYIVLVYVMTHFSLAALKIIYFWFWRHLTMMCLGVVFFLFVLGFSGLLEFLKLNFWPFLSFFFLNNFGGNPAYYCFHPFFCPISLFSPYGISVSHILDILVSHRPLRLLFFLNLLILFFR